MNIQKESQKSKEGNRKGFISKGLLLSLLLGGLVVVGVALSLGIGPFLDRLDKKEPAALAESQQSDQDEQNQESQDVKVTSSTTLALPTVSTAVSAAINTPADISAATSSRNTFVGSKGGHTFYDYSCPQVKRIKDANKVWFSSVEAAETAGYQPSKQCKSMKNP